jgi:hypothetical protein
MNEPVQWGRSHMSWSPDGYILRVTLWALERPLQECSRELGKAIREALGEFEVVSIEATPMEKTSDGTGPRADPGQLEIVTRLMMSQEAARSLREGVTLVLRNAVQRADQAAEADDKAAKQVLEVLRQSDS